MRTPDKASFTRGYAWWMLTEAKKRNPDIETYGLSESWPRWVTNGSMSMGPLDMPQRSANYTTTWVKGAKDVYNLTIDWIGMWK
jgi:galactosylceramidase